MRQKVLQSILKKHLFQMKGLCLFILTVVFLQHAFADQVEPCGSEVKCGEVGKVQISTRGTEKILEIGLDTVTKTFDIKKELNEAIDKSPDFPHKFNLGNAENYGMKASVDNLHFDELSFGPSKVNIEDRKVHVCVPIDEMELRVDAEFDIWGNKLSQKGASARIKKDAQTKPEVCFNGEVGEDGNFSDLVAVPWEAPQDVAGETKRALLDVNLSEASHDEILFSYLSLYAMEEGMELPTKFEWGKLWDLMGDFTPENAEKFFDVEEMRKKLIAIKGELPPKSESQQSEVGLRNYMGNMEIDMKLENNGPTVEKDDKVWDEMAELLTDPIPEREVPPDEGGIMSFIKGAAHNIGHKVIDAAHATKRGLAGVGNRLSMRGEKVLRERFLPYLQEKFNKNATQNPPVMTAIAKTAEKHLIPVARKHANKALQKAREIIAQENLARAKAYVPGFTLQDVIDDTTLRDLETRLGPKPMQDLVRSIDAIESSRDFNVTRNQAMRFLDDVEKYADAITNQSTDERTHRFLQSGLGRLVGRITDFLGKSPHGDLDRKFLGKRESVLYKLAQKERTLAQNIARKRENMKMELVPKLFSDTTGGPEVSLSFPELCKEGLGLMSQPLPDLGEYDASATVSIEGINSMLKRMQKSGAFDFCLYGQEARTCGSSENYDHKCKMTIPPKMVWNGVSAGHQLILDGVKCESRFINAGNDCGMNPNPDKSFLHALAYPFAKLVGGSCQLLADVTDELVTGGVGQNQGQVAIDIKPQVCGKSLCFDTALAGVNVEADLDSLSPSLKGVAGLITAIASPVTNVVKTQIVDDKLMSFLEDDVSKPLGAPVGVLPRKVESKPSSISVYADFERTPVVETVFSECFKEVQSCPERFF